MNETSFLAAPYDLLLVRGSSSNNLTRNDLQRFVTVAVLKVSPSPYTPCYAGSSFEAMSIDIPPITIPVWYACDTLLSKLRIGVDPRPLQPIKAACTETNQGLRLRPRQPLPGPLRPQASTGGQSYLPGHDLHDVPQPAERVPGRTQRPATHTGSRHGRPPFQWPQGHKRAIQMTPAADA